MSTPGSAPTATVDSMFYAVDHFHKRNFEKCAAICTELLAKNPYDKAAWTLKMRSLTSQLSVDDLEAEEEGIADSVLDTNTIATAARPGTSLKTAAVTAPALTSRPRTESGRPVSGVVRPGTLASRGGTLEQSLKTPRTAKSARPLTSQAARTIRLGTASMLSQPDGPFIQVSRLNLAKYARDKTVAKYLFEYLYHHENDVASAMDLAVESTKACEFRDWWWKVQLGKCYFSLGLIREAQQQFNSALNQFTDIEAFIRMIRVYIRLDQPIRAIDIGRNALDCYPNEVTIMTEMARIFEGLNNMPMSVKYYKLILKRDATCMEAIACIGVNHFYNDQPEMGLYNAELFNNLALCCFYSQQYDMVVTCFERALSLALNENAADVWYNISHVAIGISDTRLAIQCLHLALSIDSSHGLSQNNLAVLEAREGHIERASTYLQAAAASSPYLYETHYNQAVISNLAGDLQDSYNIVKKSLDLHPGHSYSWDILRKLEQYFSYL
ncbi:hypothetical protein M8J76_015337 [Diaphorina citri]|nr:hypothetical protein M8J75_013213 [Diaphorina citri]KAI5745901.1 hypothetical protein M8J76_015337 [Diaphorina citri]